MEIADAVVHEALKAVAAGAVWHHFLVGAGDTAFFFSIGCELDENVLQYLMRERLITKEPIKLGHTEPREVIRLPLGIPVKLTIAGENWLSGR